MLAKANAPFERVHLEGTLGGSRRLLSQIAGDSFCRECNLEAGLGHGVEEYEASIDSAENWHETLEEQVHEPEEWESGEPEVKEPEASPEKAEETTGRSISVLVMLVYEAFMVWRMS